MSKTDIEFKSIDDRRSRVCLYVRQKYCVASQLPIQLVVTLSLILASASFFIVLKQFQFYVVPFIQGSA